MERKNGAVGRVEARRVLEHPAPIFRKCYPQKTMSTTTTAGLESDEKAQKRAQSEQFSFAVDAPGMVDVTNESHDNPTDHQYVVTFDNVTGDAMACTCPHHVHRHAHCKHMAAVEDATADGSLDAFPTDDDASDETDDGPRITGPHVGQNKYGSVESPLLALRALWDGDHRQTRARCLLLNLLLSVL